MNTPRIIAYALLALLAALIVANRERIKDEWDALTADRQILIFVCALSVFGLLLAALFHKYAPFIWGVIQI